MVDDCVPHVVASFKFLCSVMVDFPHRRHGGVIAVPTGTGRGEVCIAYAGRRTKFAPVKSLDSSEFSSEFSDLKTLTSNVKVNPIIS